MDKKQKNKGLLIDLLISLVIAIVLLAVAIAVTTFVQSQYADLLVMDKTTIIISDAIGFVVVFLIAFAFLRSGRKKENDMYK